MMTLQVSLARANMADLETKLMELSTPGSPDYGKWLSKDEVEALFPPAGGAASAVESWLRDGGVEAQHIHRQAADTINFAAPVGMVNTLLNTTFAYYDVAGVRKLRTTEYSVPDGVARYVHLVHPTTFFGRTKSMRMPVVEDNMPDLAGAAADDCTRLITPGCLRSGYNIGDYVPDPESGSRIAFGSFLNESARLVDLHLYQDAYGIAPQNFSVETINGGLDHQDPQGSVGEANLDAQFQNAVSSPLPLTQFITGGSPPFVPSLAIPDAEHNTNEPYLEYYTYLLNKTNEDLPQVISNSYGDDEQSVPPDYAGRVCDLIGMMGLRGITVLESSGDTGVGAPCISNDGREKPEFTPEFPASCPYITAVGGTESWAPEIVWQGSSGGFSNFFAQPWYQADAVKTYLDENITPETKAYYESYTNFSGRAFPDISAHSLTPNFVFFNAGRQGQTGGTSAAAPVVAGIFALLNDARLRAGKPTMGFINPFLYSLKAGPLIDVTNGSATGCNGVNFQTGEVVIGGGIIPWASWNGTAGWDPGTGVGLPDFQEMMVAAMSIV
ncbi:Tripeptidyl-peptidase sed4 [Biscogniauxia mediterranea]|nr:Tripeptidyl-peptidase sed4 [Biscogniauxia mediterranea]